MMDKALNPLAVRPARAGPPQDRSALNLSTTHAEAMVRLIEAVPSVLRRHHFFLWSQAQLHALLPHRVLVCAAWVPRERVLAYEVFHSVVLPERALQTLMDGEGLVMRALSSLWVQGRGQPLLVDASQLHVPAQAQLQALLLATGGTQVLVHGVARPQRPTEIESFFIFGGSGGPQQMAQRSACLDLVLPHLHSTWQRVTATEHALKRHLPQPAAPTPPSAAPLAPARGTVTERERQILRWVREGKSNHQIGQVLGISPLTVKNHIQKILRKLGAGNRAQAVAQALAQDLIDPADRLVAAPAAGPTARNKRDA